MATAKSVVLVCMIANLTSLVLSVRKLDRRSASSLKDFRQSVDVKDGIVTKEEKSNSVLEQEQKRVHDQASENAVPTMAQTIVRETEADVKSLLNQVQGIHVKKVVDEDYDEHNDATSIRVNFTHEGKLYEYEVFAHNVYSKNAMVLIGNEAASALSVNTYTARAAGSWVTMTWHEDGSVHGLFEDSGRLMEVKPVAHLDTRTATMLRQSYEGEEVPHIIKWVTLPQLATRHVGQLNDTMVSSATAPPLGKDGSDDVPEDRSDSGPIEYESAEFGNDWGGQPWFPNCYTGDEQLHEVIVSIASDVSVYDTKGQDSNAVKADLENIVAEASFVYEKQMNIKLSIGKLEVTTTEDKFGGCPSGRRDVCTDKLDRLKTEVQKGTVPALAAAHIFTACGSQYGTVGLAYVGSLCEEEWATGSTKFHTTSPWLTYAHELGHNINADHSFEDGQGATGGVMDYGDGKLNGHYQFNTKYRKKEVCGMLDRKVNKCNGNFQVAANSNQPDGGSDGESIPTPSPEGQGTGGESTPSPDPSPDPSPEGGGKGGKRGR